MNHKLFLLFISAVMVCLCCASLGIANDDVTPPSPTTSTEQTVQNQEQAPSVPVQPAPAQPPQVPQSTTQPAPTENTAVQPAATQPPQVPQSTTQPAPAENTAAQPNQATAQDSAEESPFKSIWFWIAIALFILVIYLKVRSQFSALSRASGRVSGIEDAPEASDDPTGQWSEYLTILNGERFRPGTELYEKSVEKAQNQAQAFVDALKEKMIASSDGLNTIPVQEELQAMANSLHPKFVESICSPNSFWMKKAFPPEKSAPTDLSKLISHFFRPFQAPVGGQIQLEIPAWTIAVLVVIGAVLGSMLTGLFTRISNMDGQSGFVTFIGATFGAAVFASGIFWITANEKYRQWLEKAVFAAMGVDTVLQLAKYISPINFFGSKKSISGAFFKRMCLYLATILVLMMTKRKNAFNYADYLQKLEPLYLDQIQGIVLFVSSLNQSDMLFDEKWQNAEKQWKDQEAALLNKIERLQKLIEGSEPLAGHMRNVYNYFCDLWEADIHNLSPILHNMALKFKEYGYPIPDGSMKFVGQIDAPQPGGLSTQSGSPTTPPGGSPTPIVEPVKPPQKETAVWSQDMESQYDIFGLPPEDGDIIEITKRPIIRNGNVEQKGAARRKR